MRAGGVKGCAQCEGSTINIGTDTAAICNQTGFKRRGSIGDPVCQGFIVRPGANLQDGTLLDHVPILVLDHTLLHGIAGIPHHGRSKHALSDESQLTVGNQLFDLYSKRSLLRKPIEKRVLDEILKVKNPTPIEVAPMPNSPTADIAAGKLPTPNWKLTDQEKTAINAASTWLTNKVAKGVNGETIPPFNIINDDELRGRDKPSAFYSETENEINVPTGMNRVETNVHEMGHGIEYQLPGVQTAAQHFLKQRVGKQQPRKLKELFPDTGYGDDEEGRDDDFAKVFGNRSAWYVGKHYSNGATEVISMGVQQLFENPQAFAKKDPEYASFILGLLDGTCRDTPVPIK